MYSVEFTIFKKQDLLWEQYVPELALTFSWENLKKHICPYIHQFSNFYHRFFLDKVFLWKRTIKRLPEFIKELNNHRPTIKFDFNYSKTSTDYLDTTDYKTKGKNKLWNVYWKTTDRINFLLHTSAHPKLLIKSIPYSQNYPLKKRICTKTSQLFKNLQVLNESFINRGFNEKFLHTQVQCQIERNSLLGPKTNKKNQNMVPFVLT